MTSKTAEIRRLYRSSTLSNKEIGQQMKVHRNKVAELARKPPMDAVLKVSAKHLYKITSLLRRNGIPFETADEGFELTEYYESKMNNEY